jgi:hypothetical protein
MLIDSDKYLKRMEMASDYFNSKIRVQLDTARRCLSARNWEGINHALAEAHTYSCELEREMRQLEEEIRAEEDRILRDMDAYYNPPHLRIAK